jgi:hypothetical protein
MIDGMPDNRRTEEPRARDILAAEEFGVPAPDPRLHVDPAHDVLAAEEYGVPAPDPGLHHEPPHDVLAAEEFVVPDRDPALHHRPVALPDDPTGIAGPHDVLAAEEFALPAGHRTPHEDGASGGRGGLLLAAGALALAAVAKLLRKRST